MQFIKYTIWVIFATITITLVWFNCKLYTGQFRHGEAKTEILLQLNFLSQELKAHHLGDRMQSLFPEGFLFANVLYGLSWCELGLADSDLDLKKIAFTEALYAFDQISSTGAQSNFDANLQPAFGIFYQGWRNYLLSKILLLKVPTVRSEELNLLYQKNCATIAKALAANSSPFLPSYQGQCWPADMCVAMASLSNYEKFKDNRYHAVISNWVSEVQAKVDPRTRLIPHKVNPENGITKEGARGCSISLILRLLSEIDVDFSKEQYSLYTKNFVATTFGLPSIHEYPVGLSGPGDVDSGPVIFGVGFAGTIVSIGTFAVMGDHEKAERQYQTIHTFGMSTSDEDTKKYLWGKVPIADAFIVWGRTSALRSPYVEYSSSFWAWKFHLWSALVLTVMLALLNLKVILNKIQNFGSK